MWRYLLLAVAASWLSLAQAIDATPQFGDPEMEKRYLLITEELRCLVCQNQSVADSNAPLANDLRAKVAQMLKDGKTDKEIFTFMTERYGDFVLLTPPFRPSTLLLYLAPLLLVVTGALIVWRLAVARQEQAQLPAEKVAALRRELEVEDIDEDAS